MVLKVLFIHSGAGIGGAPVRMVTLAASLDPNLYEPHVVFTDNGPMIDICKQMAEGDKDAAETIFNRCLPLMLFEFQEGIGVGIRKYALHSRGLIENSTVRHPGPNPNDETKAEFHRLQKAAGLASM